VNLFGVDDALQYVFGFFGRGNIRQTHGEKGD
jgi:hypothetical protein